MSHAVHRIAAAVALATTACAATVPAAVAAPAFTTLDPLAARGQIAARGTVTAVTQIAKDHSAALWVGKGGNLPEPVAATTGVPDWAQPHVGTDAARKPVVIYPSCKDVAITTTCDLKLLEVLTGKVKAVPGVNSSTGEVEGVIDRGAVVAARWTDEEDPVAGVQGGYGKTTTTLVYRAVGKPARVLTTRGGQQLALDRGRVLFVRDGQPTDGVCGRPELQLQRVSGGAARTVAHHTCGMNGQTIQSPTFVGSEIVYGLRSYDEHLFIRVPAAGGRAEAAKVKGGFASLAPTSRSGGLFVDGDWITDPSSPEGDDAKWSLRKVIGLSFD